MIRPEISSLFERLSTEHQALCLECIRVQSAGNNGGKMSVEDFFYEIIVSYFAGISLHMSADEIIANKEKARQLARAVRVVQ